MTPKPLSPGDDECPERPESLNDSSAETSAGQGSTQSSSRLEQFELVYRTQFRAVVSYFARRHEDPQLVADLAADTFVAAIHSFHAYLPGKQSSRAWAIGLARRIEHRYRESDPRSEDPERRGSLQKMLDDAEWQELMSAIEVEHASRGLIERLACMTSLDRDAFELVELCELKPAEAARELDISTGELRIRLVRVKARLRGEGPEDV